MSNQMTSKRNRSLLQLAIGLLAICAATSYLYAQSEDHCATSGDCTGPGNGGMTTCRGSDPSTGDEDENTAADLVIPNSGTCGTYCIGMAPVGGPCGQGVDDCM